MGWGSRQITEIIVLIADKYICYNALLTLILLPRINNHGKFYVVVDLDPRNTEYDLHSCKALLVPAQKLLKQFRRSGFPPLPSLAFAFIPVNGD